MAKNAKSWQKFENTGHGVTTYVFELMTQQPKRYELLDQIKVRQVSVRATWELYSEWLRVIGAAGILAPDKTITIVGRETTLDFVERFIGGRRSERVVQICRHFIWHDGTSGNYHSEQWLQDYLHWDALRIAEGKVRQKVAELFPVLRVMRPSKPGEPEVLLRPHGGHRLGGILQQPEK